MGFSCVFETQLYIGWWFPKISILFYCFWAMVLLLSDSFLALSNMSLIRHWSQGWPYHFWVLQSSNCKTSALDKGCSFSFDPEMRSTSSMDIKERREINLCCCKPDFWSHLFLQHNLAQVFNTDVIQAEGKWSQMEDLESKRNNKEKKKGKYLGKYKATLIF